MTIERLGTEIRLPLDHAAIRSGDPVALDSYLTGLVNELRQITLSDVHQRINLLINQGDTIVRPPFDDLLLGYWSFDDGTGTTATDLSANGNDGTLVNMEEGDWVDGVAGKALAFGGTDEAVTIPYGTAINPTTTPISFCMWIKPTTPATSTVVFSVPSGTNQRMYIGYNGGYWAAGIQASAWGCTSQVAATTDWTFIALVMDGAYANLYVNGVYTVRLAYTTYAFAGDFGVSNFGSNLFVGSFDELRIYNCAMTKQEVQALYRYPSGYQNSELSLEALQSVYDMAADGKLTPIEKYAIKPLWDAIVAKATLTTGSMVIQAAAYSVDDSAYDTAYLNLYTYLITTLDDVFTPMTDTTTIDRTTFNGLWTAYFEAEETLRNDIADAIDAAAFPVVAAANLVNSHRADENCDATHPLEIDWKVPSNVTSITEVLLSFKIKYFRTDSTAAASGGSSTPTSASGGAQTSSSGGSQTPTSGNGGAQTSSSGGAQTSSAETTTYWSGTGNPSWPAFAKTETDPGGTTHSHDLQSSNANHTHSISLNSHAHTVANHTHTVADHTHTVAVAAHTHTVADHTHGVTIAAHDHGITYGIYEENNAPITVTYQIDNGAGYGAASAGYTSDQTDIDITASITTVGWKAIKFNVDKRARIAAIVEFKGAIV